MSSATQEYLSNLGWWGVWWVGSSNLPNAPPVVPHGRTPPRTSSNPSVAQLRMTDLGCAFNPPTHLQTSLHDAAVPARYFTKPDTQSYTKTYADISGDGPLPTPSSRRDHYLMNDRFRVPRPPATRSRGLSHALPFTQFSVAMIVARSNLSRSTACSRSHAG